MFLNLKRHMRNRIAHRLDLDPITNDVVARKDVAIEMADGVILGGHHYAPMPSGNYPTVLIRSPWGRGLKNAPFSLLYDYVAKRFAERGYHVLLHDFRQRKDSENKLFLTNEINDGRDTLIWLAQQPWFNGHLGLWGASILGYAQWAALANETPHLDTIAMVPITTATRWFTIFHPEGTLALDTLFQLQYTSSLGALSLPKMLVAMLRQQRFLTERMAQLPISEAIRSMPEASGFDGAVVLNKSDFNDPEWQTVDLRETLKFNPAHIHLIAGWQDIFLVEQLEDYQTLKQLGKNPCLTIGPWHHTDQEIGSNSIRIALKWFDRHLKAKNLTFSPVVVFVQGANVWRDFENWPPTTINKSLYLNQNGTLSYAEPDIEEAVDRYRFDPVDPTPTIGGPVVNSRPGQQDNSENESREDVITYETKPLLQNIEVLGTPTATLFVSSSLKSSDFFVRICDVQPDGRSLNVTDNLVRLETNDDLIATRREINIQLWPTAYLFAKGHKIRVQVSSGAHPRWARNLGTGEPANSGTQTKVASQTIYYGSSYPSQIILPVSAQ